MKATDTHCPHDGQTHQSNKENNTAKLVPYVRADGTVYSTLWRDIKTGVEMFRAWNKKLSRTRRMLLFSLAVIVLGLSGWGIYYYISSSLLEKQVLSLTKDRVLGMIKTANLSEACQQYANNLGYYSIIDHFTDEVGGEKVLGYYVKWWDPVAFDAKIFQVRVVRRDGNLALSDIQLYKVDRSFDFSQKRF